jgi:hypothetical protein
MVNDDIPSGLHIQKIESDKVFFGNAVDAYKDQADNVVNKLEKSFSDPKLLEEMQKKFKENLDKEISERRKEQEEFRKQMTEWGSTEKEIAKQKQNDEQELAKIRRKAFEDASKSIEDAKESVIRLQSGLDKSLKTYADFQDQVVNDIKELTLNGASDSEVAAYLKNYSKMQEESTQNMISSLGSIKDEIADLVKSDILDSKTKFTLTKQLLDLERIYDPDAAKEKDNVFKELNDQVKGIFIESKESRIAELEQLKIDKEREKRERGANKKGKLLTTLLGPLRMFTDPILEAFADKTTEEFITGKFMDAEKDRQKEEDKALEQRNKITELIESANEKLADLGINQRIDGVDIEGIRNQALAESDRKFIEHEQLMFNVMKSMPGDLTKRERDEAKEIADRRNRDRIIAGFFGPARGKVAGKLENQHLDNDIAEHTRTILKDKAVSEELGDGSDSDVKTITASASDLPGLPAPNAENAALESGRDELSSAETDIVATRLMPDNQESPLDINSTPEEESLESSMMDKISPDQATLLQKGGVVGAGVVFLAKKLGLITDAFDDANKKDKDGDNAIDFIKKHGSAILKVAAPLAVMALGGVAIAKGLQMQERDSDDAQKYFDEGNTARGLETAILGDRARLTEENANQELGRTAGKSALLAGGAGLVAAGGAGTTAMIGTVASAGGVAAAGGLGAVGTAGVAALGAALPPALIAAAVITAGMVVAKGTQEAFELGWDKNQAAIQKELADTMLSEDSSTLEKIKAGLEATWKGFTGGLAGGIREAGNVLDAETAIQNEKQINFIKEQAEAGNEGHQRLFEMMQSEQFKALSEAEQKAAMQAEGLYDEFKESQEATKKSLGEHLLTAGKTVGGFFSGLVDTTMEGMRGRETAAWEKAALKGMENMTGEDVDRLKQSKDYQDALANGKDHEGAMQAAYLEEERQKAVARGDLREDGTAIQEGNWIGGMTAGAAAGGLPGALAGALGGAFFGKYLGFGDTGMAYKEKQSDEEYRQTFEYSKKKTELMNQGMTAEEADLAAIEEQNNLYEQSMTLRLKQSTDYKKEFDKQLKEGKSIKQAEEAALRVAKENRRNTMTTTELVKDKFHEIGETLTGWARNIGGFFKEKFSAAGEGLADLGGMVKEGAQGIWNAVSEWFSGIWQGIGDKVKNILGSVSEGWDWVKGKAHEGLDWFTGIFSGENDSAGVEAKINDGIVTKDGRVIEVSPDDNIYATKNDFKTPRDQETQAAMPDVPKTPVEFTDSGIIAAIQVLTEVLKNKEMSTTITSPGESINFDQFRMADAII